MQSLTWNNMFETETVSSCLTFDFEYGKVEFEPHIRTLMIWPIMCQTCTRPTVGRSICQYVRSYTEHLLANQISAFYEYMYRYTIQHHTNREYQCKSDDISDFPLYLNIIFLLSLLFYS